MMNRILMGFGAPVGRTRQARDTNTKTPSVEMQRMIDLLCGKLASDETANLAARMDLDAILKSMKSQSINLKGLNSRIQDLERRIVAASESGKTGFVEAARESLSHLCRNQSDLQDQLDAKTLEADRLQMQIDRTETSNTKLRLMITEWDQDDFITQSPSGIADASQTNTVN